MTFLTSHPSPRPHLIAGRGFLCLAAPAVRLVLALVRRPRIDLDAVRQAERHREEMRARVDRMFSLRG